MPTTATADVGNFPTDLQPYRLTVGVQQLDNVVESVDQEDRGSEPAWMPGKRDTCPVV